MQASSGSTRLVIDTEMGVITLQLAPAAAPTTVQHITNLIRSNLFNDTSCCFYRSDFVIQCGLQTPQGTVACKNPHPNIAVNETKTGDVISNLRGTAAFGHWDV